MARRHAVAATRYDCASAARLYATRVTAALLRARTRYALDSRRGAHVCYASGMSDGELRLRLTCRALARYGVRLLRAALDSSVKHTLL